MITCLVACDNGGNFFSIACIMLAVISILSLELTTWSIVLPENLTCSQLLGKFPTLYGPVSSLLQAPCTCPCCEAYQSSSCHFWKIHFNVVLPFAPRSSTWFLSLMPHHQNFVYNFLVPHICHMSHPFYS